MDQMLVEQCADALGWCPPEKCNRLYELVTQHCPVLCVEVGVYGGRSLLPVAAALHAIGGGRCVGIDPYCTQASTAHYAEGNEHHEWWRRLDHETIYRSALKVLRPYDCCSIVRLTSEAAAPIFEDGSVSFLHIDGNHATESACGDVERWLPKMAAHSTVVVDDTAWDSVKPALQLIIDGGFCLAEDFGGWQVYQR